MVFAEFSSGFLSVIVGKTLHLSVFVSFYVGNACRISEVLSAAKGVVKVISAANGMAKAFPAAIGRDEGYFGCEKVGGK